MDSSCWAKYIRESKKEVRQMQDIHNKEIGLSIVNAVEFRKAKKEHTTIVLKHPLLRGMKHIIIINKGRELLRGMKTHIQGKTFTDSGSVSPNKIPLQFLVRVL